MKNEKLETEKQIEVVALALCIIGLMLYIATKTPVATIVWTAVGCVLAFMVPKTKNKETRQMALAAKIISLTLISYWVTTFLYTAIALR